MDYIGIGKRIRHYRKAHRLSQEELAEKMGSSAKQQQRLADVLKAVKMSLDKNMADK